MKHLTLMLLFFFQFSTQAQTGLPATRGLPPTDNSKRILGLSALTDSTVLEVKRENGSPVWVVKRPQPSTRMAMADDTAMVRQMLTKFIASSPDMFHLTQPTHVRITQVNKDPLGGINARGQQVHDGFAVYGTDFTFVINATSERFLGRTVSENQIVPGHATYNVQQAIDLARQELGGETTVRELSATERQWIGEPNRVDTLYYPVDDDSYHLSYRLYIRPNLLEEWIYYVNATDGKVLFRYNNAKGGLEKTTFTGKDLNGKQRAIHTSRNENLYYLENRAEEMYDNATEEGMIITLDNRNASMLQIEPHSCISENNTWSPLQVSAHWGMQQAYLYYKEKFGRNSLDGKGGTILGVINVTDTVGQPLANAYWNGAVMFFGNGNKHFNPFAGALDVVAHELTHGVISTSANLDYVQQSGALNESYADVFGCMIGGKSWRMGEDIVLSDTLPSGAIRDLSNPHNGAEKLKLGWQPAHMSEYVITEEDNGGVHRNSGIPNFAFYKFATAVSKEVAEQVYYRSLTVYLHPTSKFIDHRIAVIQASIDMYGQEVAKAAARSFDEVGILEDISSPVAIEDIEPNPENEMAPDNELSVYSSPETSAVYIKNASSNRALFVNMSGQSFQLTAVRENETTRRVDISSLSKGVYVLFIDGKSAKIVVK